MSETLFIRIAIATDNVQWLLADSSGGRLAAVMEGSLADAAPLAVGRRVVVIAPGSEVLLAEPELPAKNNARLQQMAPFALEEQLACDLDEMHFALGKRASNGRIPVAAIAHSRLQAWLDQLSAAGIAADAIYPESLLLSSTPDGVTLLIDRGTVSLRGSSPCGTTLDAEPLADTLALALPTATDTPVTIYATQAEYAESDGRINAAIDSYRERYAHLQIKLLPEGPLPLFALQVTRDVEGTSNLNLLQGKYAQRSSLKSSIAPWRVAAILAGVALVLHVGFSGLQLWRSARAEKQLDRELIQVLTQTLPDATSKDAGAARKVFDARLAVLKNGGTASGLLSGLNAVGSALAQSPDTHIEALAYRNRILDLRLTAPSVDALDRFRSLTQASGLQADLQSTTSRDKNVEVRLQIKMPGA